MSKFVYSTLASDNTYVNYAKGDSGMPQRVGAGVTIRGGAGVADKRLITPRGTVTTIDDAQFDYLIQNPTFKRHVERGYIVVENVHVDPERVAPNMSDDDPSRPPTETDLGESAPEVKVSAGAITEDPEPPVAPVRAPRAARPAGK